jgi:alkylresorcinol/alkylpyrone synthase
LSDIALSGLGTALPTHRLSQTDALAVVRTQFQERFPEFKSLIPVFQNAGIENRAIAMPLDWYLEPRGLAERNSAYLNVATQLFVEATKNALSAAKISAADVDTVVTISSSGIATPTLEARASAELGFRPNILPVPVYGLGCAGGVSGLALGSQLARANPGSVVLVLAVELCSLWFHQDTLTKANIVASALFGDGAAAELGRLFLGCTGFGSQSFQSQLSLLLHCSGPFLACFSLITLLIESGYVHVQICK